jgi:hypothetical protein
MSLQEALEQQSSVEEEAIAVSPPTWKLQKAFKFRRYYIGDVAEWIFTELHSHEVQFHQLPIKYFIIIIIIIIIIKH